ncbi:MAG: hypothetical protein E7665_07830 [Ruminococcaceae bacterium]|nr:hypothetical protein [Oscillospiraceae bacterium]
MKKTLLLFLSMSFVLSLISCTSSPETVSSSEISGNEETAGETYKTEAYEPIPVPEFLAASKDIYMFEDYVFSNDKPIIKYQKYDTLKRAGTVLSYDELYNTSDQRSFTLCYLVDPEETNKNNGIPVLLMAYRYFGKDSDNREAEFSAIQLFNTGTHKTQTIISGITEMIASMCLYRDTVFYTTEKGSICKVNKDGTGAKRFESGSSLPYIASIYDDKLYYYGSGMKKMTTCGIDFENSEELFEIKKNHSFFVHGDYLYYAENAEPLTIEGEKYSNICIYRRKLSDLKNTKELLFDGINDFCFSGDRLYYYTSKDKANDTDDANSRLYAYDLKQSKDIGEIYVNKTPGVKRYCVSLNDKYGFGYNEIWSDITEAYYIDLNDTFILNLDNKKVNTVVW